MRFLKLQQYLWLINLIRYIDLVSVNIFFKTSNFVIISTCQMKYYTQYEGHIHIFCWTKRLRSTVLQTNVIKST